jgi:two-component system NtrC family sensor kinase
LFEIQSDPKLLEQVFINLLSNAIYAIKQKGTCQGRIEIRTSKSGTNVEIVISDNGTGIPDEDREKIFDLFYTTKPTGKGTGLGMPICQNIVNKLGGDIIFESRVGEGTTFTVRIPVL